ncbi:hypothetical protein V6N12_028017 [Hibiscus sabdariffa]|uniref:DC1 domain-containing protein n=1 Tax=Hibiscus sabdariffa TaxID=183260 RepID=A0ABR2F4N1_9ROSI
MSLKPFLHQHHLLYDEYEKQEACCDQCNLHIDGWAFSCEICKFWLHESCGVQQLPPEISHHLHPQHSLRLIFEESNDFIHYFCNGCSSLTRRCLYRCRDCNFNLDLICASSTTITTSHINESSCNLVGEKDSIRKPKEGDEIKERNANLSTHFEIGYCNKGHPLIFYEALEENEWNDRCCICRVEISDEAYACKSCRLYIHKICNRLLSEMTHPLHPQHSLKLFPWHAELCDSAFTCQECRGLNVGFAYVCYACDFTLDVKCATSWVPKTETQRLKDMERESKLCLFNQHHKLGYANYVVNLPFYAPPCSFCDLDLSGPVYRCSKCGYSLHESCVGIPREMQIQFHLWNSGKTCLLCKVWLDYKISYSCVQCGLHLHVQCAKSLKHVLKSKSHIHHLYYYFGSKTGTRYYYNHERKLCSECKREFYGIPFCFCMECDVKLHIERVLPPSLNSKYHTHPLALKDGFKEDDSGEYYCDICEQERDLMTLTNHVSASATETETETEVSFTSTNYV